VLAHVKTLMQRKQILGGVSLGKVFRVHFTEGQSKDPIWVDSRGRRGNGISA